jgi:hypothetical protein
MIVGDGLDGTEDVTSPGLDPGPSLQQRVAIPSTLFRPSERLCTELITLMVRKLAGIYEHENKRLVKVSVLLRCDASSLHDWYHTFRESVLVSIFSDRNVLGYFECFFFSISTIYIPYGLRGLPSRLWPKCNQLLRLGRP